MNTAMTAPITTNSYLILNVFTFQGGHQWADLAKNKDPVTQNNRMLSIYSTDVNLIYCHILVNKLLFTVVWTRETSQSEWLILNAKWANFPLYHDLEDDDDVCFIQDYNILCLIFKEKQVYR